jgi:hypothetical protein
MTRCAQREDPVRGARAGRETTPDKDTGRENVNGHDRRHEESGPDEFRVSHAAIMLVNSRDVNAV